MNPNGTMKNVRYQAHAGRRRERGSATALRVSLDALDANVLPLLRRP
jgi:hypothetical protein